MRYFLIDFENVHSEGLVGIEKLSENDEIVLFHSDNANSITFDILQNLISCKAKINYYKIKRGGKNALDFQLSSYLGHKVTTNPYDDYYIVSKDSGFDFVLDFWQDNSIVKLDVPPKIRRFVQIQTILNWLNGQQKLMLRNSSRPAVLTTVENTQDTQSEPKINTEKIARNNAENNASALRRPTVSETARAIKALTTAKPEQKTKIPEDSETEKAETLVKPDADAKPNDTPTETAVKSAKKNIVISEEDYKAVSDYFEFADNAHALYIKSMKLFGQDKGSRIYNTLKSKYREYMKSKQ